jgi:superfamily II DNA/RNA helicase
MSGNMLRQHGIKDEHLVIVKAILGEKGLTLNQMQNDFIENGFLEKDRIVISTPTASGKTLLVHLKYARNLTNEKRRMIYLVPYARIRRELIRKFSEWKNVGVVSTDDYSVYEAGKAQIFVATYASVDSLLLRGKTLSADLFVFDEIDMITDDLQGTRTESSISRIIRESRVSSLFALSATIGSPELIESWLGCTTFVSDYRPVDLTPIVKPCSPEKERFEIIEEIFQSNENKREPMAVFYYNTARCRQTAVKLAEYRASKAGKKTNADIAQAIQDIATKCDSTNEVSDQIRCLNHGVAFYFARLQPQCKDVIERLFERNVLDIVFTTPALARGVNLPIRTVVIPSPFKYSKPYGTIPISRTEIEQIFGRAGRPPFQDKGFGILLSTEETRTQQFQKTIDGKLEKISSKFVQSAPRKGRTLNRSRLAVEVVKEARMQNRSKKELMKCFDSYLFVQEIKDKENFYKFLEGLISVLMKTRLLETNIDGEIITPSVVDIIVDSGIDDLKRIRCLMNLSSSIVNDKLEIFSGHILTDILYSLCRYYAYGIRPIKDKYDFEKIRKHITERTQIQPPKIDDKHRLFMALDLYSTGMNLEMIQEEFGLEPDSIPYIADKIVSQDLILLNELVKQQCMEDHDKLNFCDYLEMCANIMRKGVPFQVLPFIELIDRFRRKSALSILEKYGSKEKLLRVLGDKERTSREFVLIKGIGKTFSQRIIENREELIVNLQKKIKLWGTFSFS